MLDIHPEQDTHQAVSSDKNIYFISVQYAPIRKCTQRRVHTHSQTLDFFTPQTSPFVPWCQCKILVLSNNFFFFFSFFLNCRCFFYLFIFFTNVQIRQFWNPSALCEDPREQGQSSHAASVLSTQASLLIFK